MTRQTWRAADMLSDAEAALSPVRLMWQKRELDQLQRTPDALCLPPRKGEVWHDGVIARANRMVWC